MVISGLVMGIGNKNSGYQELLDGVSGTFIRGIRNGQGAHDPVLAKQLAFAQPCNFFNSDI
jgi:hypothetical protein